MSTATDRWTIDVIADRWRDVLRSIESEGKEAYALAPWQALPGEERLAFLAFRSYLANDERSVPQVAAALSIDFSKLKRWATEWEWERRAQFHDLWLDRSADEARAELVRKVAVDTAAEFARLPAIVNRAQSLIEGTLNAFAKAQETAIVQGTDVEHLSINQAMKLADSMRALIEAQSRFLGQRVDINVDVSGTVKHKVEAPSPIDVLNFRNGLAEANLIDADSSEV